MEGYAARTKQPIIAARLIYSINGVKGFRTLSPNYGNIPWIMENLIEGKSVILDKRFVGAQPRK